MEFLLIKPRVAYDWKPEVVALILDTIYNWSYKHRTVLFERKRILLQICGAYYFIVLIIIFHYYSFTMWYTSDNLIN